MATWDGELPLCRPDRAVVRDVLHAESPPSSSGAPLLSPGGCFRRRSGQSGPYGGHDDRAASVARETRDRRPRGDGHPGPRGERGRCRGEGEEAAPTHGGEPGRGGTGDGAP